MRAAAVAVLLAGCMPPVLRSGEPVVHETHGDVIWVTRAAAVQGPAGASAAAFGLFACYRPAQPGEPVCHLARYVDRNGNEVTWGAMEYPATAPAPASTPPGRGGAMP